MAKEKATAPHKIEGGYQPQAASVEQHGYQPQAPTAINPQTVRPPRGDTAIVPPTAPASPPANK